MKYLKLFESFIDKNELYTAIAISDNVISDMKNNISDILLDLHDKGFQTQHGFINDQTYFITMKRNEKFKVEDIIDTLNHINNFMEFNNYEMNKKFHNDGYRVFSSTSERTEKFYIMYLKYDLDIYTQRRNKRN